MNDDMSLPGDCQLVSLPKITDRRGNLSFIEGGEHIPFDIRRVYYLYDVPSDSERGGHAHQELKQLIIAMSGSFNVVLDDGVNKSIVTLNRPDVGLLIENRVWRELNEFSSGAVCFVLASEVYDESDYYRDYDEFLKVVE